MGAGTTRDETWAWDGLRWTKLEPSRRPSPSDMVYLGTDEHRQRVVLVLGRVLGSDSQTWEWDGATWEQRAVGSPPPFMSEASGLAFEPSLQRLVVVSPAWTGRAATVEWTGQSWVPRSTFSMAFEPQRRRLMLIDHERTAWYLVP